MAGPSAPSASISDRTASTVPVARRLRQVGVGKPAFRHQGVEQQAITLVRASDRSTPPCEAFEGQLPAEHAVRRPVTHQEVFATLYTNIGLNLSQVRIFDPNGRPQYLLEDREPIRSLLT